VQISSDVSVSNIDVEPFRMSVKLSPFIVPNICDCCELNYFRVFSRVYNFGAWYFVSLAVFILIVFYMLFYFLFVVFFITSLFVRSLAVEWR